MHSRSLSRFVCVLWSASCLLTCQGWEGSMAAAGHEAFIGWKGETYLPPPAVPAAAMAAEPLQRGAGADAGTYTAQATAVVDQLQDIPAGIAPSTLPGQVAAPEAAAATTDPQAPTTGAAGETATAAAAQAATPTVAAPQHLIDLSTQNPSSRTPWDPLAPWVQHLSWHPRLHLHHNLLTPRECDIMRELLSRPSGTVGGASSAGQSQEDEEAKLMLMIDVEQRVANWTALAPDHLEGWQLQRGFTDSDAALHTDLLTDRTATEDYQRARSATVLLFLGDDSSAAGSSDAGSGSSSGSRGSSGGSNDGWSLVFPAARGGAWRGSAVPFEYKSIMEQGKQVQKKLLASQVGRRGSPNEVLKLHIATHHSLGSSSSDGQGFCDGSIQAGLTLKGFPKGSALLIWNTLTDNQTPDAAAAHLFCANGGGQDKLPWIATTWMQNMRYGQDSAMALASVCEDTNPACSMWAAQGFCDDAPGLMLGLRGMCRHSCQDCRSCDALRPSRPTEEGLQSDSSSSGGGSGGSESSSSKRPSLKSYMDCIYGNMHSLRQEWSEPARTAGVRKARNAIRRDLRLQAATGIVSGHLSPSQQQSSWTNVW